MTFARLLYRELHEQRPVLLLGLVVVAGILGGVRDGAGSPLMSLLAVGFFSIVWPTVAAISAAIAFGHDQATEYVRSLCVSPRLVWAARAAAGLIATASLSPGILFWRAIENTNPDVEHWMLSTDFGDGHIIATAETLALRYFESLPLLVCTALLTFAMGALLSVWCSRGTPLVLGALLMSAALAGIQGALILRLGWMILPPGLGLAVLAQAIALLAQSLILSNWQPRSVLVATAAGVLALAMALSPFLAWAISGSTIDATSAYTAVQDVAPQSRLALLHTYDDYGNTMLRVRHIDTGLEVQALPRGSGFGQFLSDGRRMIYEMFRRTWGLMSPTAQYRLANPDTGGDEVWWESPVERTKIRSATLGGASMASPDGRWLVTSAPGRIVITASEDPASRREIPVGMNTELQGWTQVPTLLYRDVVESRPLWDDDPFAIRSTLVEVDPTSGAELARIELPELARHSNLGPAPVTGTSFERAVMSRDHVVLLVFDQTEAAIKFSAPRAIIVDLVSSSVRRVDLADPYIWVNSDASEAYWLDGETGSEIRAMTLNLRTGSHTSMAIGAPHTARSSPYGGFAVSPDSKCFLISDQGQGDSVTARVHCRDGRELAMPGWWALRFLSNGEAILDGENDDGAQQLALWDLETNNLNVFFGQRRHR